MILLSNTAAQTIPAGQSLVFTILRQTGCSEFARENTSPVFLKPGGVYDIDFHANVTNAAAATPVQLSLSFAGATLPETTAIYTPAVAGAVGNVSGGTTISTHFPGGGFAVTLTNTGTTDITISPNPVLRVRRIG